MVMSFSYPLIRIYFAPIRRRSAAGKARRVRRQNGKGNVMTLMEKRKPQPFFVALGEPSWIAEERRRRLRQAQAGERFRLAVQRVLRRLRLIA